MNPAKRQLQRILTGGEIFNLCDSTLSWLWGAKMRRRGWSSLGKKSTGKRVCRRAEERTYTIKMWHNGRTHREVTGAGGKQRESELLWGWKWWLCGACVSRVPGAPSLADHGWREDKICSCTRGGGGWGKTESDSNPCLPLLLPTQAQTPSNPSYQKSRWVQPVTRKAIDITDAWVLMPVLCFGEFTNTVKTVMVRLKDGCYFLYFSSLK